MNDDFQAAREAFRQGQLLAYPTEAVFGFGCDPRNPEALQKLLALKQRPQDKGLILLAADYSQLLPFVDDRAIPQSLRFTIFSQWPGFVTQLLPAAAHVPAALRGAHDQIAVRITAFEPARQLCKALNSAIVSTSANRSGEPALRDADAVAAQFADELGWIMHQVTGGAERPSRIVDPMSQRVIRE